MKVSSKLIIASIAAASIIPIHTSAAPYKPLSPLKPLTPNTNFSKPASSSSSYSSLSKQYVQPLSSYTTKGNLKPVLPTINISKPGNSYSTISKPVSVQLPNKIGNSYYYNPPTVTKLNTVKGNYGNGGSFTYSTYQNSNGQKSIKGYLKCGWSC